MAGVMNLAGYVAVGHGHAHGDVFTIISMHIVGMYGLVLFVGDLIDRIGRRRSMVIGLRADGGLERRPRLVRRRSPACASRCSGSGSAGASPTSPRRPSSSTSPAPSERGRLVGFSDLLSSFTGAALALAGGVVYTGAGGSVPLAGLAAGLASLACAWVAGNRGARPEPAVAADPATIRARRTPGPPFLRMKTYSAKPGEITRDWYVVDAEGQTLGRLATLIADRLRGKGKPHSRRTSTPATSSSS